jgi:Flp pilus assembly protein TadD
VGSRADDEESLAIRRKLAAADPTSALDRYEISWALERLGDAQFYTGDYGGALKSQQECADLSRAMVAADPSAGQDQRYLWYCMMRIGATQVRQGDFTDGLKTLSDSLTLARKALAATGSAEAARDVVLILYQLANAQNVFGDAAGGLKAAQDGADAARKVAAANPLSRSPLATWWSPSISWASPRRPRAISPAR